MYILLSLLIKTIDQLATTGWLRRVRARAFKDRVRLEIREQLN